MGLIDFVKSAGQKLGLGSASEDEKEDAAQKAYDEAKAKFEEARRGVAIARNVTALGLDVEDLKVKTSGDRATVSGKVKSQDDKEKVVLAVGNTEGIGQVDDRLVLDVSEPEGRFYTVQSGDTLGKIAKEQYGDASKYPAIFEANRPMLSDPDKIYPGQNLRIPSLDS